MMRRHQLERSGAVWRCSACEATWTRSPTSACVPAGQRLYRVRAEVPAELNTVSALRRAGLRLRAGSRAQAVFEDRFHRRYGLYCVSDAVPARPLSEAQHRVLKFARSKVGSCPRCGESAGRAALVRRRTFLGVCKGADVPFDRLCVPCYGVVWKEREHEQIEREKASWRTVLPRLAVLDFETTALVEAHVVEVAVWGSSGLLFHQLVNPGSAARWEREAIEVHGLIAVDVATANRWPTVAAELGEVLRQAGITHLGAWGGFDRRVAHQEAVRHGLEPWSVEWVDLMNLLDLHLTPSAPAFWRRGFTLPARSRTSLARACRRFGVPPGVHRAAADAEAAYCVLRAMVAAR